MEWVNTVDPVVATLNTAGLSTKPSHPNAARRFIHLLLSKPAQERLRALTAHSRPFGRRTPVPENGSVQAQDNDCAEGER